MKKILILIFLFSFPLSAKAACVCLDSISLDMEITSIYPNPAEGETEWIEIYNSSTQDLDLSFYTLEDNTEKPYQLDGTLKAKTSTKINGFTFQLNNGGDSVTLKTIDGDWIDSLSFSSSKESQIITKDQTESNTTSEAAITASVSDKPSAPSIWPDFSEAMPNPEGTDSTEEWIELFNPYSETLSLDGLYIDDADGGSSPYKLSGTLDPYEYLLISVEDSGIALNNSVDAIRLLGVDKEVLWEVPYENPKEGESFAYINGTNTWTNNPTPNGENLPATEESETNYINGDLSENLSITEVFPNPEGPDQEEEWIEITNGGSDAVNLGNWILDDGNGGSDPYIFPDNTVIEPGETLIISRTVSGIALNNSNETVTISDFTGEIIDEITYESSEEGLSLSKIEIEEMNNTQASASGLGTRIFTTWQWTDPSPGAPNAKWQQYTGEVENYDGKQLEIFDGVSNRVFETNEDDLNKVIFNKGNKILVQAALKNNIHILMYSELLESAKIENKKSFPWGLILTLLMAGTWLSFQMYKEKKKHVDFSE